MECRKAPMSTTQRDQRRRAQRRNVSTPSVIRVELRDGMGNPRNITADLTDMSDTGLSLNLVAPIKPGAIIMVRGKLGDERVEISRRATITWCNEDPKGGYRAGVEFMDMNSAHSGGSSNQHSDYKQPHVCLLYTSPS